MSVIVVAIVRLIIWDSRVGHSDDIHHETIYIFTAISISLMYLVVSDHCSWCCKAMSKIDDNIRFFSDFCIKAVTYFHISGI